MNPKEKRQLETEPEGVLETMRHVQTGADAIDADPGDCHVPRISAADILRDIEIWDLLFLTCPGN